MNKSTADVLREARELISDPEHWTQGTMARGRTGREVLPRGRAAVAWCAAGACVKVAGRAGGFAMDKLSSVAGGYGTTGFNDHHSHAEVLALFDEAVTLAERYE